MTEKSDVGLCRMINRYWSERGVQANARIEERMDTVTIRYEQRKKNGKLVWVKIEKPYQIVVVSEGIVSDVRL